MIKCLLQHTLSEWSCSTCMGDHFAYRWRHCQRHPLTWLDFWRFEKFRNLLVLITINATYAEAVQVETGALCMERRMTSDEEVNRPAFEESFTVDHTTNDERRSSQQTCFWGVLYSWSYFLRAVNARKCYRLREIPYAGNGLRRPVSRKGGRGQRREPAHPLNLCRVYLSTTIETTDPGEGGLVSVNQVYHKML